MKVTTDACLFGAWTASVLATRFTERSNEHEETLTGNMLDIGTGTGLLSLMVAQKTSGRIDAIELDAQAAAQAAENVAASPWPHRIQVIQQHVLQWQPAATYTCIFSNPPFYENDLRSDRQAKNIAHHDGGLRLNELLEFIQVNLTCDGYFFLLLPFKRSTAIDEQLRRYGLFTAQKVYVQQTPNHPPFRVMIQGSRQPVKSLLEETIMIRNEANDYTPEFMSLLESYYFYL